MGRPRTEDKKTCANKLCDYYLKEKGKDILRRGKNAAGHQQYYCNHCKKWFVETTNTPLYHKHLSEDEIIVICKHLVEKNGIRSIERITGHHRDTIGNLLTDLAEHAQSMTQFLVKNLNLSPIECDEFWSFVKKSKRTLSSKAKLALKKVMSTDTPA